MQNNIPSFLFIILLIFSCNTKDVSTADELKEYLADEANGLSKTNIVNNIHFTLSYYPTALILQNELAYAQDSAAKNKIIENYSQFEYFKLSISKEGKNLLSVLPKEYYSEYVNIFSFRMQDFIYLKRDNSADKKAPLNYQFEQLYGLSSEDNFLFVFDKADLDIENSKDIKIIIEDFGLSTGKQVFNFSTSAIHQVKEIHLTNPSS